MSELDTREKLEADIQKCITCTGRTLMYPDSANHTVEFLSTTFDGVIGWLDRQAAITERECIGEHVLESPVCATCKEGASKLRVENAKLQAMVDKERQKRLVALARAELAEHALADREQTHMRLPVDADGVPIRPGDYMALGDSRGEVIALTYTPGDSLPWEMQLDDGECYRYSTQFARHVQPDTVESLLQEFADEAKRCCDDEATVADFAERIRRACNEG